MQLSPKEDLEILIKTKSNGVAENLTANQWILEQLQSLSSISIGTDVEKPKACSSAIIEGHELYVPLADLIDVDKERERIESEIKRIEGWLKGVNGKLNNANFVNNAPDAVVENERNKKRDGEANLAKLREQLKDFE